MELKLNSWYSKWLEFVYLTDKKPKTVCELFWKLIASPFVWVLSNPLWIFAFIWRKWQKKDVDGILYIIPIIFNTTFLVILDEPYWNLELIMGWTHLFFMAIIACVVIFVANIPCAQFAVWQSAWQFVLRANAYIARIPKNGIDNPLNKALFSKG